MKKVICLLLILTVFATSSVFAANETMITTGGTSIGTGLFFFFLPSLIGSSSGFNAPDTSTYLLSYGAGTLFTVGGLLLVIFGAMQEDNSYYAMIDNQLPDIVSFDITGDKVFIGAKFSFK